MMETKIVWITASYFIDVDRQLVPFLREKYHVGILWIVLQTPGSAKVLPHEDYCIWQLHYRNKDPRCFFEVIGCLRKIDISGCRLVYSDALGMMYYTALLHWAGHIPVVHAAHNVIPYPVWPVSLKMDVKYIFTRCRYFQLFSKHTAHWFKEHYPRKSFFYAPMVVKDFGNVRTRHFAFDPDKVNLLFFGNVVGNKRLDLLIEAMKKLPKEVADRVHLNICGKCKEKEKFLAMIGNAANITADFRRIEDDEIPELFVKSHYLMLPYEDVAQSGPHMIAYNYNLPVIASDIDGFAERVVDGENGFLFKKGDVQSLIAAIVKVAQIDESTYIKMKRHLKEYTEANYKIEIVAKKYMEYFELIMR